jgi:hypothetical protein
MLISRSKGQLRLHLSRVIVQKLLVHQPVPGADMHNSDCFFVPTAAAAASERLQSGKREATASWSTSLQHSRTYANHF